ncbi:PKD domain-containing protein [Methanoculleus frigidifontis]|nr:PKD domain-containing protein [Methanoculleus sp. FWC-SCC1]
MGLLTQGALAVEPTPTPVLDPPSVTVSPEQITAGETVTISLENLPDASQLAIRISSTVALCGEETFALKATNLRVPFSLDSSRVSIQAEPVTEAGIQARIGWLPISLKTDGDDGVARLTQGTGDISSGTTISLLSVFGTAVPGAESVDLFLDISGVKYGAEDSSLSFGLEGVANGSAVLRVSVNGSEIGSQEIIIGDGAPVFPEAPAAAFCASPENGTAPLTVSFTDTSTGSPTSWIWDFGDGTGSSEQHPVHTYTAQGTYTISLAASNAGGSNSTTRSNYITVAAPPLFLSAPALTPARIPTDSDGVPGVGETATLSVNLTGGSGDADVAVDLSPLGGSVAVPMVWEGGDRWTTSVSAGQPSPHAGGAYSPVDLVVTATDRGSGATASVAASLVAVRNGDVNEDGRVTLYDATYIGRSLVGLPGYTVSTPAVGDVTGDGVLTLADAMYLAKHLLGVPGFEVLR